MLPATPPVFWPALPPEPAPPSVPPAPALPPPLLAPPVLCPPVPPLPPPSSSLPQPTVVTPAASAAPNARIAARLRRRDGNAGLGVADRSSEAEQNGHWASAMRTWRAQAGQGAS